MQNSKDKSNSAAEQQVLEEISARHGVSLNAMSVLLSALKAGGGTMAQFNHPELGGMGQWSSGMLMIGEFSNAALKQKVLAICQELSTYLNNTASQKMTWQSLKSFETEKWWPDSLGSPASAGGQNDIRYAYFPALKRLAIKERAKVTIFDTGEHEIFGVSQEQGLNDSLIFESQLGRIRAADLPVTDCQ